MAREGFSHRRTTTKQKRSLFATETIRAIVNFHLDTIVYQQRFPSIKPVNIFNRDQVPMGLAASCSTTIDEKNKDVI